MRHAGSSFLTRDGTQAPCFESECRVLTTGPPGKSLAQLFLYLLFTLRNGCKKGNLKIVLTQVDSKGVAFPKMISSVLQNIILRVQKTYLIVEVGILV